MEDLGPGAEPDVPHPVANGAAGRQSVTPQLIAVVAQVGRLDALGRSVLRVGRNDLQDLCIGPPRRVALLRACPGPARNSGGLARTLPPAEAVDHLGGRRLVSASELLVSNVGEPRASTVGWEPSPHFLERLDQLLMAVLLDGRPRAEDDEMQRDHSRHFPGAVHELALADPELAGEPAKWDRAVVGHPCRDLARSELAPNLSRLRHLQVSDHLADALVREAVPQPDLTVRRALSPELRPLVEVVRRRAAGTGTERGRHTRTAVVLVQLGDQVGVGHGCDCHVSPASRSAIVVRRTLRRTSNTTSRGCGTSFAVRSPPGPRWPIRPQARCRRDSTDWC